ncbi:MAG: N-methyl-L-tryptophan oxidase [Gemmatimonadaceae bacterium]
MTDTSRPYNVIVIGLGAMGSATLFHLAKRGSRVAGFEQFKPEHRLGSSHGDSRIIRETYFEDPLYVPLVQRAHELWRELEEESGKGLMTINGGLMIGPRDGAVITGTLRSAREHSLPHALLSPADVRERFPAFHLGDDLVAVFDPRAGYLDPERCNAAHVDGARKAGAEVHSEEPVLEWNADGAGVSVRTSKATYRADRIVVAAGAWSSALLADLALPLTIERQVVFWLEPERQAPQYDASRFPIYAYEFEPGTICYGFPRLPRGVKAAVMHRGEIASSPEKINRTVEDKESNILRAALYPVLPDLSDAPVRGSDVCLFTNTPDHDFIVDFHPRHPQVLISSPCSGHGFKFASAIGELQADILVDGTSRFDLSPFRIGRFQRRQSLPNANGGGRSR